MNIIQSRQEGIKDQESLDGSDIDTTATELLGLWEFVVESYDIDEAKQKTIFRCRIHLDYAICPRCNAVIFTNTSIVVFET